MLILDKHHNIPNLEWNSNEKAFQVKDRDPLPRAEAQCVLADVQKLILLPLVAMRSHSTRKLVKEHTGEWNDMSRLAHSGLWRVCAMTFPAEKINHNTLNITLHRMISEPCAAQLFLISLTSAIVTPLFLPSSGRSI